MKRQFHKKNIATEKARTWRHLFFSVVIFFYKIVFSLSFTNMIAGEGVDLPL